MRELVARTLKVSMIVASLFVFGQLSAQAMPAAGDKSALDATGFFPGGWDRNDLRSDAAEPAASLPSKESGEQTRLDESAFFPGGWDHNDLRAH